jgi:hypothetical protein
MSSVTLRGDDAADAWSSIKNINGWGSGNSGESELSSGGCGENGEPCPDGQEQGDNLMPEGAVSYKDVVPRAKGEVDFGMTTQSQPHNDMDVAEKLSYIGDALSYSAGAIGGAQIGMMQYRSSLSIHSKVGTFSRFSSSYSSLAKFSGRLGTAGALVGVGFNINKVRDGKMGLGRFLYRSGSIGAATLTGAAIGGPWGAVAGTAVGGISTGIEYLYDNYMVPLGNEIQYQIWNFENAVKNGWYPGR